MIPLELMPPLMFAGLVVFMLFGFPVAFSLSAVGLFFGFIAIEEGFFTLPFLQAIPGGCLAVFCPMICCWRFRSSPSWARYWRSAGWRRTCWRAWASCSGRCAAGLAIR